MAQSAARRAPESAEVVPLARRPGAARRGGQGEIVIDGLEIAFANRGQRHRAIETTSLSIAAGTFVSVLGPSGCGKSTLLNAIAGLVPRTAGRVLIDGGEVTRPGGDRGMVFQQPSLFPWKTVLRNIAVGPQIAGASGPEAERVARTFLEMVGLKKFADYYPAQLSGGMQQRIAIARALANYPRVLLMDEPFGALDAQTRAMMQENLLKLWSELKTTVVFVTHDVDEAIFLADRVLVMSASPGRIIDDVPVLLQRPRDPEIVVEPEFTRIKKRCLSLIREESLKAFAAQGS